MKTVITKESDANFAATVTQSTRSRTPTKEPDCAKAARPSWWEALPLSKPVRTARGGRRATEPTMRRKSDRGSLRCAISHINIAHLQPRPEDDREAALEGRGCRHLICGTWFEARCAGASPWGSIGTFVLRCIAEGDASKHGTSPW